MVVVTAIPPAPPPAYGDVAGVLYPLKPVSPGLEPNVPLKPEAVEVPVELPPRLAGAGVPIDGGT